MKVNNILCARNIPYVFYRGEKTILRSRSSTIGRIAAENPLKVFVALEKTYFPIRVWFERQELKPSFVFLNNYTPCILCHCIFNDNKTVKWSFEKIKNHTIIPFYGQYYNNNFKRYKRTCVPTEKIQIFFLKYQPLLLFF